MGYADLPRAAQIGNSSNPHFMTIEYQNQQVRMVTSVRRLALADQPIDLWLSVVQTCKDQDQTLAQTSGVATIFGGVFL